MKTKSVIAAAATVALASALVSCSAGGNDGDSGDGGGGGGSDASNCTNKITKTDLPVVTMWAWYPNMETVVDNFNEASTTTSRSAGRTPAPAATSTTSSRRRSPQAAAPRT